MTVINDTVNFAKIADGTGVTGPATVSGLNTVWGPVSITLGNGNHIETSAKAEGFVGVM